MQLRNSSEGYGAVAQSFHWFTVVMVVLGWALGTFDDVLPKGAARAMGLFVHISAGLAILGVLVLRLSWRMADPPPPPETTMFGGAWLDHAGRVAHYALYGLLVAGSHRWHTCSICAGRCFAYIWIRGNSFAMARRSGIRALG